MAELMLGVLAEDDNDCKVIAKPKETLIRMSRDASKKPRYSENVNHKLAEVLELMECKKKCPAFAALYNFMDALAPA